MENYGYMEKIPIDAIENRFGPDEDVLKVAITKFQHNFALRQNGEFDDLTKKEMSRPRCGVSEANVPENSRNKRYQMKGPKWDKTHLTWR